MADVRSSDSPGGADRRVRRNAAIAGTIGNVLTAYDFIVYTFFAPVIGQLFFPHSDPAVQILASLATFGVGFVMRPLGGIVLGVLSDRRGRRLALTVSIALMTLGIVIFVATPTYAVIGAAAPIAIVAARLIQGFAAGGEFPGVTAYLSEYALASRRGYFISWQQASQFMASLLGAVICTVIAESLSADQIAAWGWRAPFVFGLLIGPIGLVIRNRLEDTPLFRAAAQKAPQSLVRETLRDHGRAVAGGFGMVVFGTVSVYVVVLFLPTYVTRQFGIASYDAFLASAAMSAALIVLCLAFGTLSDRVGRKPVILGGSLAMILLVYPLFRWFAAAPGLTRLLVLEGLFAVAIAALAAPAPAMMAELVPTRVRNTTISLSYNLAVAIFGGFGQFIVTWLILSTDDALAPAYYVIAAGIVGTVAVSMLPDRTGIRLE